MLYSIDWEKRARASGAKGEETKRERKAARGGRRSETGTKAGAGNYKED